MLRQESALTPGELNYYSYKLFESLPQVVSIASTRLGGLSVGPFHSLNLALSVGDERGTVFENRARLYQALGVDAERVAVAQLIQGTRIAIVTEQKQDYIDTDGLITNVLNRAMMILIADCAPVTLYDPQHRAIGLAHAGWRGTVSRIVTKMVEMMRETFGSAPTDILAAVGPSIGPCCYEVKQDLVEKFHEAFPQQAQHFFLPQADDTIHLDMWVALRYQLLESGILPEHIEEAEICTACHPDEFYSNRAEQGRTGRFAGLVMIR